MTYNTYPRHKNTIQIFHVSLVLFLMVLLFGLSLPSPVQAAPPSFGGSLDNTFGLRGKVLTDFGGNDRAYDIALQTDGKLVVAGANDVTGVGYFDFCLARYNNRGMLDTTFGTGGKVIVSLGFEDVANALALQTDGKIVAAGYTYYQSGDVFVTDVALARFNSNGSLDTTFGAGGMVVTDFAGGEDRGEAILIQGDGKIVVAGYAVVGTATDFALVRYNPNGTLDNTFGTGGKVTTDLSGFYDYALAIGIQSDGKLVVAGQSGFVAGTLEGTGDFALARYDTNGNLDTTFGNSGIVVTDIAGEGDAVRDLAIQQDGKIVAAGTADTASSWDFALVRYNFDGSLDTSFGSGGKVTTDFGVSVDEGMGLAIQADGKYLVAGMTGVNGGPWGVPDFGLARYHTDGALDTTFGTGGLVVTDFDNDYDNVGGVLIQADGKIVVAGDALTRHTGSATYDFALARYKP